MAGRKFFVFMSCISVFFLIFSSIEASPVALSKLEDFGDAQDPASIYMGDVVVGATLTVRGKADGRQGRSRPIMTKTQDGELAASEHVIKPQARVDPERIDGSSILTFDD